MQLTQVIYCSLDWMSPYSLLVHCLNVADSGDLLFTGLDVTWTPLSRNRSTVTAQSAA